MAPAIGLGLVATGLALATPVSAALASGSSTTTPAFVRVSVSNTGQQVSDSSLFPALSADASVVAFTSDATTLVAGDTNDVIDVFVRDRNAGTTERVDVSSAGVQADEGPGLYFDERPAVSGDGQRVAYTSRATNLVAGDANGHADVFVRDRLAGTTVRVSVPSTGGEANDDSYEAHLSADGRYVAFLSYAALAPEDTDGSLDAYRKDLQTGTMELVSIAPAASAGTLAMSSDGRYVAYSSANRIYRRDLLSTAVIEAVTLPGGAAFDAFVHVYGISPDGNRLLFQSGATNASPGDPEGDDAYWTDVAAGVTTRLTNAVQGSGEVWESAMSADGSVVTAFQINRPLKVWSLDTDWVTTIDNVYSGGYPALSADGSVLAVSTYEEFGPGDTNSASDIYVGDLSPATDDVDPVVSCDPADADWHRTNVTVWCTATDTGSGLASGVPWSFSLSTSVDEGAVDASAATSTREVCDNAGNCVTASSTGHKIDRADPTATIDPSSQGTFTRLADVPAAFACSDEGSGVESCSATAVGYALQVGDPVWTMGAYTSTIDVFVVDQAGNTAMVTAPLVVSITSVAGTITDPGGAPLPGAVVSLWPVGAPDRTVWQTTAEDGTYSIAQPDVAPGDYQVQVTLGGYTSAWFGGSDRASATVITVGHRPQAVDATLVADPDNTPPSVSCSPPTPFTIYSANVSVTCTASDDRALADPADGAFALATTVADGAESASTLTTTRSVCDTSDNCTTAGPFGEYRVDRKAPSVTIANPAEGAVVPSGVVLNAAYNCTDLHLTGCSLSTPNPQSTTPGAHSFSVTGTDVFGRTTTVVRSYTVPSTTFHGRVFDLPQERPVAGAEVEVWPVATGGTGLPAAKATTAADGTWSIPNLTLNASYFIRYSKAGYNTVWQGGSATAAGSQSVSSSQPNSGNIYAWLTNEDSTPPTVQCSGPSQTVWRTSEATMTCTAADASGLTANSPANFTLSTSVGAGNESANAPTGTLQICDVVGNCTTAGPYSFKVDRKGPTLSCQAAPTIWLGANAASFCNATDGGVGTSVSAFSLSTTVGAGQFSANASTTSANICDFIGNCSTTFVSGFKIDRAAPVATCGTAPTTWIPANSSVTCNPSDAGAGYTGAATVVASTSVAAGSENANASATTASLCDAVNNCAPKSVTGFKVDRKGPTFTCAAADGLWHNANISRSCGLADLGSGMPATYSGIFGPTPTPSSFTVSTNAAAGTESATQTASQVFPTQWCDNVGNCATASVANNKIDRKAPTTTCPAADTAWHSGNVAVTCQASDGGSGAAPTFTSSTAVAAGVETATAAPAGALVCDAVGNCASVSAPGPYKVDRKAASVACPTAPAAGTVADHNLFVSCTGADGGVGLADPGDALFDLSTSVADGEEAAVSTDTRSVCDAFGSCTTAGPFGPYTVDRKAPVVDVVTPAPGLVVAVGTELVADYSCADLLLVSCSADVADGDLLPADEGSHQLTVTGVDQAGHVTTVQRSYTVLADSEAPTVTCLPPAPTTTWRASQVTVACTASDLNGLGNPAQASFVLTTTVADGAASDTANTGSVQVCDVVGNCTTVGNYGPYKIDREAPSPGCATPSTAWSKIEISVRCVPVDTASGPVSTAAFALTTTVGAGEWDASASTTSRVVCDKVGNCTTAQLHGLKVDRAMPIATCDPAPTGWSKVTISVPCTPTDPGSGYTGAATVNAVTSVLAGAESASADASVRICDVAGNCTYKVISGLKVDRRSPVVTCDAPDGQWHATNVTLACQQSDGGSGLVATNPDFTASTAVLAGTEAGNAAAKAASACDQIGNCTVVSILGNKIDRRAPTAVCPPKDSVWHGENVTVTCVPIDGGVGPAPTPVTSSTTVALGSESPSASMSKATMCDLVGNCAQVSAPGPYKVDRKAPTITINGLTAAATVLVGSSQTVTYSCADSGSGLATCAGGQPSGTVVVAAAAGPASFTVTATDAVGNVGTKTVSWTVASAISGTVLDSVSAAPVADATVWRYPATGDGPAIDSVQSAPDGTFRFDVAAAGSYRFAITKAGTHLTKWYLGSNLATARVMVFDGVKPLVLTTQSLIPAAVLQGRVVSSTTAEPIAGVQVNIYNSTIASAPPIATAVTQADGTWRIDGLGPATYRIQMVAAGYRTEWHANALTKSTATPVVAAIGAVIAGLDDDLIPV